MKLMNINVGQFIKLLNDDNEICISQDNRIILTNTVKKIREDMSLLKMNITCIDIIFDEFNDMIFLVRTSGYNNCRRRLIGKDIANVLSDDIGIYYCNPKKSREIIDDKNVQSRYIDNISFGENEYLGAYILIEPSM